VTAVPKGVGATAASRSTAAGAVSPTVLGGGLVVLALLVVVGLLAWRRMRAS
jgi:hypothetical protein